MQLAISEYKVFDGRKFKTNFKPLTEMLDIIPCEVCEHNASANDPDCNPESCGLLESWIIKGCLQ